MQADMTTLEGQLAHYRAIDARVAAAGRSAAMERSKCCVPVVHEMAPAPQITVSIAEEAPPAAPEPDQDMTIADLHMLALASSRGTGKYSVIADTPSRSMWKIIVREILTKHCLTFAQLVGDRRQKELVVARHEAWWLASKLTTLSLPMIGKRSGNRDHTTILYGIRKYQWHLDREARPA